MDTVLLRTFLEVSKTRHFGRAAENLFITHSAVSFRIKQLEETVGSRLFNRQRNNLQLTAAGERLIPYAENMLAAWHMALQEVGAPDQQTVQLSLGGTANIWDVILQELLPDIAEQTPKVSYRTEVNTQINLVRSLLDRSIDLGLVFDPPKIAEVNVEPLLNLPLQLVSTAAKNLTFGDIQKRGYVYVDWGSTYNLQHAKIMKQNIAPLLHTSQAVIAREYVLKRGAMAFLPKRWLQGKGSGLHKVAGGPEVVRSIYAIYRVDNDKYEQLAEVIQLLRNLAGPDAIALDQ